MAQCVNQLSQRTGDTVSAEIDLALLAGTNVMLDTDEVVLDRAQRIVSVIHLVYICAKFAQPTAKALVVIGDQEIIGNLVYWQAGIPLVSPVLE